MMFKRVMLVTILVLSIMALAACGGDDKPEATATPAPAAVEPTAAEVVAAAPAGDAANGAKIYSMICIACHGPDAKGVTCLGKDLTTSEWVATQSDAQLVEFIKTGRDAGDPLNTTGVSMPPKGGNPAMSEQEIVDIVAYVRSIHQQ